MDLELRHLRALCAIADAGSLTRAAATLGVSQPALTAQLQRIEWRLGGRLFDRGRNGSVPTTYGEFVLARAREVLLGVDELLRAAPAESPGAGPATLRVGGVHGPVLIGLADRIGQLLPRTEVAVHAEYSPRLLLDLLVQERLDAVAVVDYPGYELHAAPEVVQQVIATEPVFVALPEGHRLAAAEEVALADLAAERWVLSPPDGAGWPHCFREVCRAAGFQPHVAHQVAELRPLQELIASQGVISPCQATFPQADGVTVRPIAGSPLMMRHIVAWRTAGALAPYACDLARLGREAYTAYLERRPRYLEWLRRHRSNPESAG